MIFGRVAMLALAKRKMINNSDPSKNKKKKKDFWEKYQMDSIKDTCCADYFVLQRTPISLWFLGLLFTLLGVILIILVCTHQHLIFLDDIEGLSVTSKLIISFLTFIAGNAMIWGAKREKFTVWREQNELLLVRSNLFGCKSIEHRFVNSIVDINIVKRGMLSFYENSIHYILRIRFGDGASDLELGETSSFGDIKRKYIQLCSYLEKDVEKVESVKFIDESTVTLEWKKKKTNKKSTINKKQLQLKNIDEVN